MSQLNNIRDLVLSVIARLSQPLSISDLEGGWTEQNRNAMLKFFERLLGDLEAGVKLSEKPEYLTIVRGLDHWGVVDGDLFDEALQISAAIREAM